MTVVQRCKTCQSEPFEHCRIHACTCEAVYVNRGNPRCIMMDCIHLQKKLVRDGKIAPKS